MDRVLLRPSEVAEILGIGRSKAYELCASNQLKVVRIGKSIRVPVEALHQWINEQMATDPSGGPEANDAGRTSR